MTIVFMLEVMPTIMALVCLGLMRTLPSEIRGPGLLAASLLLMALAGVTIRLPWAEVWVATFGTACFIASLTLVPAAFAVVDQRKPPTALLLALAIAAALAYAGMHAFGYRHDAPIALMLFCLIASALTIYSLLQGARGERSLGRQVSVIGVVLVMVSALIRIKSVQAIEPGEEALGSDHVLLVSYLTFLLVGLMVVSVGLILLATERLRALFEHQASHDALTGVLSRRGLWNKADSLLAQARAKNQWVSLLMIDADLFKQINDRHGHLAGDQALVGLVDAVRSELRASDLIGRFGGEEFAALVLIDQRDPIASLSERICRAVAHKEIRFQGERIPLTVSIGCSEPVLAPADLEPLIRAADAAMYRAKSAGRNQASCEAVQIRAK